MKKQPLKPKRIVLRFRATDKHIFDAVRSGTKKVETRANTIRYKKAKAGDILICLCEGKKFERPVKRVRRFKNPLALLKVYKPSLILPGATKKEVLNLYKIFYKSDLKKIGILAFELE